MARPQALRKQGGGSDEVFRAQSNVEAAYGGLAKTVLLDGVFLENITVNTTETLVEHKLNRPFRGYIICKNNTFCDLKSTDTQDVTKFITLQASATCVVSLWVF